MHVGAKAASAQGASEESIRRHGRWLGDRMTEHYLIPISYDAIRPLAGFPVQKGSYFLKRDVLDPSQSLQQMLFPEVDGWLQKFENNEIQSDMAGVGFLRMMLYLRRVILQDAVVLMDKFPDLPIWRHQVFSSPEFLQFRSAAARTLATVTSPFDIQLRAVVPLVEQQLRNVQNVVVDTSARSTARLEQLLTNVGANIRPVVREELQQFATQTKLDLLQSIISSCRAEVERMTSNGASSNVATAEPMELVSIIFVPLNLRAIKENAENNKSSF